MACASCNTWLVLSDTPWKHLCTTSTTGQQVECSTHYSQMETLDRDLKIKFPSKCLHGVVEWTNDIHLNMAEFLTFQWLCCCCVSGFMKPASIYLLKHRHNYRFITLPFHALISDLSMATTDMVQVRSCWLLILKSFNLATKGDVWKCQKEAWNGQAQGDKCIWPRLHKCRTSIVHPLPT